MSCPCSRSRLRWLRRLCSLVCAIVGCCSAPLRAQESPLHTISEDISAFAYGPNGRIVYSVRHPFSAKLKIGTKSETYDVQREDIWIQDAGGKRRRVIQGDKLTAGNFPFSYLVNSFCFSSDGRMILAELDATFVIDEDGNTRDAQVGLLFDENGKQIKITDQKELLFDAANGGWLADNVTIVYFKEVIKPHLLYSISAIRHAAGRSDPLFAGRTFVDAVWLPKSSSAIAIERDRALTGPPRLQRLDLVKETDTELATLDGYAGGLSVSPSGAQVAYFVDHEVLEVRDLASLNRVARTRVGFGVIHWSPDEKHVLLKRAPAKKSGDLVWVDLPPFVQEPAGRSNAVPIAQPVLTPLFHGLTIRDFEVSPDGRFLAFIQVGKRNLVIYPLPAR